MNAQTETKTELQAKRGRGRPKKTDKPAKAKESSAQVIKRQAELIEKLRAISKDDFNTRVKQQDKLIDAVDKIERANKHIKEQKEKIETSQQVIKKNAELIDALEREVKKLEKVNFFLSKAIYINNGGNA